jgi:hypothetical protein
MKPANTLVLDATMGIIISNIIQYHIYIWLCDIAMENGPFIDDKQYIDMIPFT